MRRLRPVTSADVDDVLELLNASLGEPEEGKSVSREGAERWMTAPGRDLLRDACLVVEGGDAVGCAIADVKQSPRRQVVCTPGVSRSADVEGIAHELLDWLEARAQAEGGAVARALVADSFVELKNAVEAAGYRSIRLSYRMEVELDDRPPAAPVPNGIVIRTFVEGDAHRVWQTLEDAFSDLWEYPGSTFEEWKHESIGRQSHDPSLWFLAFDDDELAGISLCGPYPPEPVVGWVWALGVRRAWRRRGLGRALLLHSFATFRDRGYRRIGLSVDAGSETGATQLYEGVGMRPVRTLVVYEKNA